MKKACILFFLLGIFSVSIAAVAGEYYHSNWSYPLALIGLVFITMAISQLPKLD